MNADVDGPGTHAGIEARLDELTDLFRRRLLDDRDKRRMLDDALDRVRAAEAGPFRQYLYPVVAALALVLDRLDAYEGADPDFAASVRDELLEVLGRHGVTPVVADGPVDPGRHEVVAVDGAPGLTGTMEVTRLVRRGFEHAGWVFRPAQVVAASVEGV